MLGIVAAWRCGADKGACEGNFSQPVSNGGAEVQAFYALRYRSVNQVRVDWNCPDGRYDVRIRFEFDGYEWFQRAPCNVERFEFSVAKFRDWRQSAVVASVLLEDKCSTPTYLLAWVTTPAGFFTLPYGGCQLNGSYACLVVNVNLDSQSEWVIRAGKVLTNGKKGPIGKRVVKVDRPLDCHVKLEVDVQEREASAKLKQTDRSVAELVF